MADARRWYCHVAVVLMLFLGGACASNHRPVYTGASSSPVKRGAVESRHHCRDVENRLWAEFQHWEGTRHAMGGTDRSGVDCSGFVKSVYKRLFDTDLPRTTRDQIRSGFSVARHDLQPGDLVFFRPPGYPRHVGIYLGQNAFIHASKTKGVTLSRIEPTYWGRYYWTARRILPDS